MRSRPFRPHNFSGCIVFSFAQPKMIARLEQELRTSGRLEESSHLSSSSCTSSVRKNSEAESDECTKSDRQDRTNTSGSIRSISSSSDSKNSIMRNLLRAETVAVLQSKACFSLILALAAVLTGLFTYRYTTHVEQNNFEKEVCPINRVSNNISRILARHSAGFQTINSHFGIHFV
jgi:hypothetical protein